jgi:hypothetical protein
VKGDKKMSMEQALTIIGLIIGIDLMAAAILMFN